MCTFTCRQTRCGSAAACTRLRRRSFTPSASTSPANLRKFRAIVESPGFRKHLGTLEGEKLKRVPRGFPADHPAAELLKFRQYLAGAEFPASLATSPKFYGTLLTVFREVTPLTRFLNAPLLKG